MASTINAKNTSTGVVITPDASGQLELQTADTTRMTIDSSGNVGINTSSPGSKLDVNGIIWANNGSASAPSISSRGETNAGLFFGDDGVGSYLGFSAAGAERMRIDRSGNVSITQTPGRYTVDTTGGATSIANNGTVDFANASGMLIVNSHNSGNITVYLCGAGTTTSIGSVGTAVGTFTYVAGIAGYRWTNNSGSTATVGFFFVRTRPSA